MRPGPNKRSRGRNNGNNQHHNRPRMPHRIQTFDSNGPNIKIRGNAYQVFERYVALAREAAASGDRIAAENLYQHAEHYFRVMNANGEANSQGGGPPRPTTPADRELGGVEGERQDAEENLPQPRPHPLPEDQPPGF
ncbi:MAG: DUF4167 domain-containing protein [Stellaceae bacterium]